MKIILEHEEAERYQLAIRLYDLNIALSRCERLNVFAMMQNIQLCTEHVESLTHCLREYLDECAYVKKKEKQNNA